MTIIRHTAQHGGQTFVRASMKPYSHVILARPCYDHAKRIATDAKAIEAVKERHAAKEFEKFIVYGWTHEKGLADCRALACRNKPVWADVIIVEVQSTLKEPVA
jgi:hypothetical protein